MPAGDGQTPRGGQASAGGIMTVRGYEQLEEIGRGGFAVVYRAWQPAFKRHVAIKLLSSILDEAALQRFERECVAIGALSGHPNIVTVHELGTTDEGRPYIVMECLEGGSAGDRLLQEGPFHWADVVEAGVKLAGALESAHRANVLHRDVKPENVLFSRFGDTKLADFGIARIQGRTETQSGQVTASVAHAAPEILSGRRPSESSDVYSLASTLFALLSGTAPFVHRDDETILPILARIASSPVPDLRRRGVPEPLCAVIEQAMAKDPSDRGFSALTLGRRLQHVQQQAGLPVTRLPLEGETTARPDVDDRTTIRHSSLPTRSRPSSGEPRREADEKLMHEPTPKGRPKRIAVILVTAVLAIAGVLFAFTRGGDLGARPEQTTSSISPAVVRDVVFRDDFSSAASGWTAVDDEVATMGYEDGQYRIGVKVTPFSQTSDSALEGPAFREDLTSLGDVSIEVDATVESGDGLFGLVCRQQGTGGHHYVAIIDSKGSWGLFKAEDETRPLSRGEISVGEQPARTMHLRLDCVGGQDGAPASLRLVRDGRVLGEAEDEAPLPPGLVGMTVRSSSEPTQVLFDNFVVRQADVEGG